MASYREEEDPFEEDIVFDQAGLLTNTTKMNTAIRRVSSGKCALFAKTLGLCGAFFGLGLCIAIPGPTFLRPITELQADISPISSIYTARSSGYLIGSIIGGILFDHFNRLFLLFISLLLTAVFITVTPWCRVLWLLEACMVFLGMTMGFLDTGGNVLCLDLWGRNSGPFMQALHFSFGLGAFVAPLLAAPFLEPSSMEVSPTFVASTVIPVTFQVHNFNSVGFEHEKRSISQVENIANMITKMESSNNNWLENSTKLTETISLPSKQIHEMSIVSTTINPLSVGIHATDGLDINGTSQIVSTTQKDLKEKPVKTNASSLGTEVWDEVHVGTVSQEDLQQPTPFLEPSSKDVSPTYVASKAIHLQEHNFSSLEHAREKRSINQVENTTNMITKVEYSNNSSLENSTKPTENVSIPSIQVYTVSVSTTSNPVSVGFDTTDSLDANGTTQTVSTTQRVPKRKPPKTNASSLGNKDWDKVHVGTVSQEDLQQPTTTTSAATTTPLTTSLSKSNADTTEKEDLTNVSIPLTILPASTPVSVLSADSFTDQIRESNNTGVAVKENKDIIPTSTEIMSPTTTISSKPDPVYLSDKMWDSTTDVATTSEPFSKSQLMKQPFLLRATESSVRGKDANPHFDSVPTFDNKADSFLDNSENKLNSDTNRTAKSSMQSVVKNVQPVWSQMRTTTPYETQTYPSFNVLKEFSPSAGKEFDKPDVKSDASLSEDNSMQPVTQQSNEMQNRLNSTKEHSILTTTDSTWFASQDGASPVSVSPLPGHIHHSKPLTYDNDTEVIVSIFDIMANRIEKYGFSKIQFTYFMVGLFVFAISLVFLGFLCHNPRDPKSKQEEGQGVKKISNRALHGLLITLMALFFLLYVGLEVTYGQLVLAFAMHGDLQLARSTGLVIAVVFWGSFAAMRFASIFFSSGFGPITMLLLNFVFCTLGTVLLSTMASHTETALWVGTALLGIGLASVFPTGILWIERYIHISNKVAAAFVMSASLGEMVCPIAVYRLMINNPAMLMHSAVVINVLCILTFIAIRGLALRHGEKYCAASNNGYQLANQEEEEDMIDMSPSGSMVTSRRHSFSSEHRALLNGNLHRGP